MLLTSWTFALPLEPAEASDAVFSFKVTFNIVLPANELKSNLSKVVCAGEELTYNILLVPPLVESGFASSV